MLSKIRLSHLALGCVTLLEARLCELCSTSYNHAGQTRALLAGLTSVTVNQWREMWKMSRIPVRLLSGT